MDRLQAWMLGSRTRYALVWGAIYAAGYCSLILLPKLSAMSAGRVASYTASTFVLAALARSFWYPRAKRKFTTRPG